VKSLGIDELFGEVEEIEEVEEIPPEPEEIPEEAPEEPKVAEVEKAEEAKAEQKPPTPQITAPAEEKFEIKEAEIEGKDVYMVYGIKGHGKTYLALTFPGTIKALSFDRKTARVWQKDFKKDARIKVYDAIINMDYSSPERMLETSEKTFKYINYLLDSFKANPPDWILIDGVEIFEQVAEMTMRYRNNLQAYQGIANRNLWKERRLYIKQLHNKALSIAKKGVIYTTYVDKDEIVVDGELVTKQDVPRWIDAIMYETDTVIKVRSQVDKAGRKFFAEVESSKGSIPTGVEKEVTNIGIKAFGL
jgi:hypothetical protein